MAEREELGFAAMRAMLFDVTVQALAFSLAKSIRLHLAQDVVSFHLFFMWGHRPTSGIA